MMALCVLEARGVQVDDFSVAGGGACRRSRRSVLYRGVRDSDKVTYSWKTLKISGSQSPDFLDEATR